MKRLLTLVLFTLPFLVPMSAQASKCEEVKKINHVFPADTFTRLKINALAGILVVTGEDTDAITINATACANDIKYLDQMSIDIDDSTDDLEVTVIIPYNKRGWNARYAYIDVRVTLPRDQITEIRDSSGNIELRNMTISSINDSSGHIYAVSVRGDLRIDDSSGDIRIRDLQGNLVINDSSGRIDVRDVKGSVTIPRDSSGDIEIDSVTGRVLVERDGSGEIDIENVKQNVTIGSDGSGSIRISKVDGSVHIGRDGSGNIRISYVEGDFMLESKGSGSIRTSNVKGTISTPR